MSRPRERTARRQYAPSAAPRKCDIVRRMPIPIDPEVIKDALTAGARPQDNGLVINDVLHLAHVENAAFALDPAPTGTLQIRHETCTKISIGTLTTYQDAKVILQDGSYWAICSTDGWVTAEWYAQA